MGRKKRMTPAQKAAARRDGAERIEEPAAPEPVAPGKAERQEASLGLSAKSVLVALGLIALVAAASYASMGGLG